ncbi:MAG: hypothetical protein Q9159_003693 [Coniocarpon cinnabarinum]
MSVNLLQDLDDFYNPTASSALPNDGAGDTSLFNSDAGLAEDVQNLRIDGFNNTQRTADGLHADDEDEFGDFETAQPQPMVTRNAQPSHPHPVNSPSQSGPAIDRVNVRKPKSPRDSNVLFDAEDEEPSDDDDFGDFEREEATISASKGKLVSRAQESVAAQPSLIDIDDVPNDTVPRGAVQGALTGDAVSPKRNRTKPGLGQRTTHPPAKPVTHENDTAKSMPAVVNPDEAEWEDFEAAAVPTSVRESSTVGLGTANNGYDVQHESNTTAFSLQPLLTRETPSSPQSNVPPPTILLSVFPSVAETAKMHFFDPLSNVSSDDGAQQAAYAQTQVHAYLSDLLALSIVLARIVAGRKTRWKRDTWLAQSMRISQASAGGRSGGMKLAGLDRAENAREERDVADAVRAWRSILGRLRSAVNAARSDLGPVPEIKEDYALRIATEKDGAVLAPKQCVLCGLKRNERIVKVDHDVQDSFGEWWVEHWGHKDCARFWETYEGSLKGR